MSIDMDLAPRDLAPRHDTSRDRRPLVDLTSPRPLRDAGRHPREAHIGDRVERLGWDMLVDDVPLTLLMDLALYAEPALEEHSTGM